MTEIRPFAGWLRLLTGLAAAAGVLALSACGGGSGAPNNTLQRPLQILPTTMVVYSGLPSLLSITRGTGPFRATSSNSGVLPVAQNVVGPNIVLLANNVAADTDVTITIEDLAPSAAADPALTRATALVTVRAAPLASSLTITPNLADCGTGLCSGQTGTASVTVLGTQGGPVAGRAVRFDVIGSAYAIVSNNPAQPLVSSLTTVSDSAGNASVVLKANVNAPTQNVQLSVTDLTSGQRLIGNFIIIQVTDGTPILTVVPETATITGAFKGVCSTGFTTDYYIYGGTPPYRITSTFPNSVTLVNSVVNTNGGFFRAITNGSCVDPLTFSILDATGRQVTAELKNVEGTEDVPTVTPAELAVSPTLKVEPACTGKTFNFVAFGGTAPYNVRPTGGATATPQTIGTSGGSTLVSGLLTGSGDTTVVFIDSSSPQKSTVATITCSAAPNSPPLSVQPPSVTVPAASAGPPATTGCTGVPFPFFVSGGTPPYTVNTTRGTAAPSTIATSNGSTTITGLTAGTGETSVVFFDSSVPQQSFRATITCS